MTNDEKYNMITACVQGAREGKTFEMFNAERKEWQPAHKQLSAVIRYILEHDSAFRVDPKPKPKTVRVRMYWSTIMPGCKIFGPFPAMDDEIDKPIQNFHDWAGDEQILTVPEV